MFKTEPMEFPREGKEDGWYRALGDVRAKEPPGEDREGGCSLRSKDSQAAVLSVGAEGKEEPVGGTGGRVHVGGASVFAGGQEG